MIFKPRIFISSTLNENLNIRNEIEDFFLNIGAEAMLYEKTLTPSTFEMTYRKDIHDADFIIFIIKNQYGNVTENGISGTHEELRIALETNIPRHVYIKLDNDEKDSNELIKEIENNNISYYYFKDDKDLLKRIKETTFTIARDIMLKKVEDARMSKSSVKKIAVRYDYEKAMEIINIIESMLNVNRKYNLGWVDSTILIGFISPIKTYRDREDWVFIDSKAENILDELLALYNEFSVHSYDYSSVVGSHRVLKIHILGEVMISNCKVDPQPRLSRTQYEDIIVRFLNKYLEFKEYIGRMKVHADSLN